MMWSEPYPNQWTDPLFVHQNDLAEESVIDHRCYRQSHWSVRGLYYTLVVLISLQLVLGLVIVADTSLGAWHWTGLPGALVSVLVILLHGMSGVDKMTAIEYTSSSRVHDMPGQADQGQADQADQSLRVKCVIAMSEMLWFAGLSIDFGLCVPYYGGSTLHHNLCIENWVMLLDTLVLWIVLLMVAEAYLYQYKRSVERNSHSNSASSHDNHREAANERSPSPRGRNGSRNLGRSIQQSDAQWLTSDL